MAIDGLQKQRFPRPPVVQGLEPPTGASGPSPRASARPPSARTHVGARRARADARAAVHVVPQKEVAYPCAALVVLQSGEGDRRAQRFTAATRLRSSRWRPTPSTLRVGRAGAEPEVRYGTRRRCRRSRDSRAPPRRGGLAFRASIRTSSLRRPRRDAAPRAVELAARRARGVRAHRPPARPRAGLGAGALITHGVGSLRYWTAEGTRLTSRRGLYGGAMPDGGAPASQGGARRAILCVAFRRTASPRSAAPPTAIQQWDAYGQCTVSRPSTASSRSLRSTARPRSASSPPEGASSAAAMRSEPLAVADARVLDLSLGLGARRRRPPARVLTGRVLCARSRPCATASCQTRGGEVIELPLPWDTPPPPGALAAADGAPSRRPCCSRRATRRPGARRRRERARGRSDRRRRYVTGGSTAPLRGPPRAAMRR